MSEETKSTPQVARGLEGIIAAATKIAEVDGGKRQTYPARLRH